MAKKIVQDIVSNGKRSIRDIPIEHDVDLRTKTFKKKITKAYTRIKDEEDEEVDVEEEEKIVPVFAKKNKHKKSGGGWKYFLTFIIILASVAIIGIALSLSYSKAIVTITQKVSNFDIDGTFTAKKSVQPLLSQSDEINYEVVSVSESLTQTIPATKGPLIQTKAKGVVTIYNNYSSSTQILVAGTRLVTAEGNVYRTVSTISVPGKKTLPGSISVNAVADQAGSNYNIKLSEFKGEMKLIGYKGTPKYAGFYAKPKTDIVGGFSGNKMIIDDTAKKEAVKSVQATLKEKLISRLELSIPKDRVLYNGANNVEYEVAEPVMKGTTEADLTIKGTIYGAIFNNSQLIKYIAGKEIRKFPSETYIVDGDKDLKFNISNIKDFSAKKGTPLIFTLKGPIKITGTFSEDKLKDELKGIKLKDSNAVFAKYSAISNAYALITPFWLRSFPDSVDKITVEYKH